MFASGEIAILKQKMMIAPPWIIRVKETWTFLLAHRRAVLFAFMHKCLPEQIYPLLEHLDYVPKTLIKLYSWSNKDKIKWMENKYG